MLQHVLYMTHHHHTLFIFGAILAVFVTVYFVLQPAKQDHKTHIYMLDIGQGDSFLIVAAERSF